MPQPVFFDFKGIVTIDRSDVSSLEAPCKDLIVNWMCPHGMKVAKGDPIIIFDTSVPRMRLELTRHNMRQAEARVRRDNHRLQVDLNELREQKAALETELAVVQASLRRARSLDFDFLDLLKAQYEADKDTAQRLRRDLERKQALVDLGQISVEELAASRIAMDESEGDVELSQLKWKHEAKRIDAIEVARLEVTQKELMLKLGQDKVGHVSSDDTTKHGIEKRIEAMEHRLKSQLNYNEAELERASNEAREALRDSFDHTPINFIEVFEADSGKAVHKVAFGPVNEEVSNKLPAGFVLDDGSKFQTDRGYGWDDDQRGQVKLRSANEPLQQGVALIKGQTSWRCRVEPGTYRLRIGVGDEFDWHGPLIRYAKRALLSRISVNRWEVIEDTVRVDGEELVLTVGDDLDKAMRAPGDGVVKCRDRLYIGQRVRRAHWPVAYFAPNDALIVEGIVHRDLIDLLKEAKEKENSPNGTFSELWSSGTDQSMIASETPPGLVSTRVLRSMQSRRDLASHDVTAQTIDRIEIPCSVKQIDNTAVEFGRAAPIWWVDDEKKGKEQVARKVILTPSTEFVKCLRQGEAVRCTVRLTPREGMRIVPAHLVVESEGEAHVLETQTGSDFDVEGIRVGRWFVVTAGIDVDTELAVPMRQNMEASDEFRFEGEVIAGKGIEVGAAYPWGRIKDLLPDGSDVEKGQLIITLMDPYLEARHQEIRAAKTQAREQYLQAMNSRRIKTVETKFKHDDKVLDERRARLRLRELEEHDPIESATEKVSAEHVLQRSREAQDRHKRYAMLETASSSQIESHRIIAEKSACRATKARLDLITALRQTDRLMAIQAQREWLDAVDAVAGRAEALEILQLEEQASRLKSELELHVQLEGEWREIVFEQNKYIRAPASGRLFYLIGWDDHTNARAKYKKDFPVMADAAIAQILDMNELGMEAQLPEKMYRRVNMDSKVVVGFDQWPGLEVEAWIDTIGESFVMPDNYRLHIGARKLTSNLRVFTVKVLFSTPNELADHLIPGTKGFLRFP